MNNDFSDIRFTSSDGRTVLNYFRESYQENQSAVFWVRVPDIPAYSEIILYQYYDNKIASYDGNGESVFEFYDDFSDSSHEAEYDRNGFTFYGSYGSGTEGFMKIMGNSSDIQRKGGYLSPKNIKMKNLYIKTKIFLEQKGFDESRQGLIEYRKIDENNFYRFGLNQKESYNYRGPNFERKINGYSHLLNYYKQDFYNKWVECEVKAYESNHQVSFISENIEKNWSVTSHYLTEENEDYRIYITNNSADISKTATKVDYLMIGQYTQPEPKLFYKSEDYQSINGRPRNNYADFLGWDNRKTIEITNITTNTTSTAPLIDYPVKIELNYLTGMQKDFSDVRFTDSDKKTVLDYWNEFYIEESTAVFWVKVPEIPANGSKDIYMYYDNPSATYIGNGERVFVWFDDFETARWSEYDYSKIAFNTLSGILELSQDSYISPKGSEISNFYLKTKMRLEYKKPPDKARQGFIDYRKKDDNNYWRFGLNQKDSYSYRGLNLLKIVKGQGFYPPLLYYKKDFWNEWDTYEIWAFDDTHKLKFTDESGNEIVNWSLENSENKTGDIYLIGGIETSLMAPVKVDYIFVSQYKEPEIDVSIKN